MLALFELIWPEDLLTSGKNWVSRTLQTFNQIFTWLSEHESGFSALFALVVIVGATLYSAERQ